MFHDDLQIQFVMLQIVVIKYWDVEGDIQCGVTLKRYSGRLYWFQGYVSFITWDELMCVYS